MWESNSKETIRKEIVPANVLVIALDPALSWSAKTEESVTILILDSSLPAIHPWRRLEGRLF